MAIIAKGENGNDFELIPEGVYTAICYSVIDLGVQYNSVHDTKQRKIQIRWEIPELTMIIDDEEKPRVVVETYTLSLSEKANLRKALEAWRGRSFTEEELKGFDLENILGKGCLIQIVHSKDGKYANINSFMALPKGTKLPDLYNHKMYFDLDSGDSIEIIDALLDNITEKTREKIKQSETYLALKNNTNKPQDNDLIGDDEIPF